MPKGALIDKAAVIYPQIDWSAVSEDTRTWPTPLVAIVNQWAQELDPDNESYPTALLDDAKADIVARFDKWLDKQGV